MSDDQDHVTSIRFPPAMIRAARVLAAHDGKNLSAWIRDLIEREIAQRDACPTCGHAAGPSDPPRRDVSGTTNCGTERAASPSKRDHAAAWSGIGFNTKEIQG